MKKKDRSQRHTHATTACFEDGMAVLSDVLIEEDVQIECAENRLKRLLDILQERRKDNKDPVIDGIEVQIREVFYTEIEQRAYQTARLKQLLKILQEGREGPNSYDPDRPAGERPKT